MRILVTGASGLVGAALVADLEANGHEVLRLGRRPPRSPAEVEWDPDAGRLDAAALGGLDAVVHLAGENVAAGRWNAARKARIRDSRVDGTRLLVARLLEAHPRPRAFVGASAVGYYGDRGDEVLDERAPPGEGFFPEVCVAWEGAARPLADAGVRVAHLRIGIVLSREGGALKAMLPIFRLGLGGRLGRGDQWMSWIALKDLVRALTFAVEREVAGPFAAVAPAPVTNSTFTRTLGRVLRRPTLLPVPAFALRIALGREMADSLLLSSLRVVPRRLEDEGFAFVHPELEGALRSVLDAPAEDA